MSGRASREKGRRAETKVTNWFRSHGWPMARRLLAGDGLQPGDIDGVLVRTSRPFQQLGDADVSMIEGISTGWRQACIEVKDQATYCLPAWIKQAEEEAKPGEIPLVVFHPVGVGDVGDWFVITKVRHLWDPTPESETT